MTTDTMTPQQAIKATLEASGIPFKQVECYGSQIVVTATSHASAKRWASLIKQFATLRGVVETVDEVKKPQPRSKPGIGVVNTGRFQTVWRVFGAV